MFQCYNSGVRARVFALQEPQVFQSMTATFDELKKAENQPWTTWLNALRIRKMWCRYRSACVVANRLLISRWLHCAPDPLVVDSFGLDYVGEFWNYSYWLSIQENLKIIRYNDREYTVSWSNFVWINASFAKYISISLFYSILSLPLSECVCVFVCIIGLEY